MPKLRVVLSVGRTGEVVADVVVGDGKAALVEAINLLALETELKPGWTLHVEEVDHKQDSVYPFRSFHSRREK